MSKEIYESKITSDAAKRFRMLCEYTFNITEDDEEIPMEEPNQNTSNNEMPDDIDANEQPIGNTPSEGDEPMEDMNNQGEGAPGFNPSTDENGVESQTDSNQFDNFENDDEVIDVDDLTQSQEETEEKVDDIQISLEKGFDKLLNVVDRLNQMIDASTSNMEQIKQEIEKRNPTPLEKLNMRAANDSYPFNVSPNDFWKDKELNSNYRIGGEGEDDAKQYTITQNDIDSITDFSQISKELDSSEFNQNLMNIFGLR